VKSATRSPAVEEFAALVKPEIEDEAIDLLAAALAIARMHYPGLDSARYVAQLDDLAARVRARISDTGDAGQSIAALNRVLYAEEGFKGNTDDYYDPRNSFLNDVLDRKLGIPITLALVYMEVARRVGFPVFGVGMPGHFLLKHYEVDGRAIIIDAFHAGAVLTPQDCQQRLNQIYGSQVMLQSDSLSTVNRRQMLTRMLNNLKSIYAAARDFRKALRVVDMVLAIYPRSPEDVKQRAVLHYNLGQLSAALRDFEDYLKIAPEASDAEDIRQVTLAIQRTIAGMN
jgi:regulator of sirC expression with transglutaminase-like and TPR domain